MKGITFIDICLESRDSKTTTEPIVYGLAKNSISYVTGRACNYANASHLLDGIYLFRSEIVQ